MKDFLRKFIYRAVIHTKGFLNYLWMFMMFIFRRCDRDMFISYVREDWRWRTKLIASEERRVFKVHEYNGKKIHTLEEANEIVADAIEEGKPFMAGRYGSEMFLAWNICNDGKNILFPRFRKIKRMCYHSGFFPLDCNKKYLIKFGELMRQATMQVDLIGIFYHPMEEWMLRTYGNNPEYCLLGNLDPIIASSPWSVKLEGKKVVIIHPFKTTIESQYRKRELLFPGRNVLPDFELRVVKAVQTIAGNEDERFADWFEALEYMFNEAMKEDFDVAIIGCGAYGFPLAAKIKQAGKIAIHLGGATQLMFGIKGKRWDVYGGLLSELMKNPAWVRPIEEEKPMNFEKIEGGCYW